MAYWEAWEYRDAGAAWAARSAGNAPAAWVAKAAWTALILAAQHPPDLRLTIGLREAYAHGLGIAIPTAPGVLGWAMGH